MRDAQTNFGKVSCHRGKTRFYMRDVSARVLGAMAFAAGALAKNIGPLLLPTPFKNAALFSVTTAPADDRGDVFRDFRRPIRLLCGGGRTFRENGA
jgi:hypothetical protein